ncbi:MAG: hypothetical protein HFI86_06295 [Bacilli bacterium]|nr:hypothetical protein [Bacilli bacterium]
MKENLDDNNKLDENRLYNIINDYINNHIIDLDNFSDCLDNVEFSDFIDDDVEAYFIEVGRIPLLSSEEEKRLLIEISNGNKESRKKFIESNLRLVISIARKYVGRGLSFDDLIAFGNIWLLKQ